MAQPGRRQAGRDTEGAAVAPEAAAATEASPLSDADEAGLATVPLLPAVAPAVEDAAGEGYPAGRPVVGDRGGPVHQFCQRQQLRSHASA